MTKLTLEQQEQLFGNECKVINLKYEYEGYTGSEKWAIITELTEEEIWIKYPDVIRKYNPHILLSISQGDVIRKYQRNEAKHRMRMMRCGHAFDINDGEFEEHHPEFAVVEDVVEQLYLQEEKQRIRKAIETLTDIQKRRILAYFFDGKTSREIAAEEGVNYSKVEKSINLALKKIKILLSEGVQNGSPSSNK